MTKRNPFPPLATQSETDRKPSLPTPGDWIGGVFLAVIIVAGSYIAAGLS